MTPTPDLPVDPATTLNPGRKTTTSNAAPDSSVRWDLSDAPTMMVPRSVPGEITGPTYRLLNIIGRGGMGEVWEAEQSSLHRIVAVKRLREERDDWELRAAFHEEALTAARLDHPNIVPIYDLGHDSEGHPLLAMKLVRGRAWNQMLAEDFAAMSPEEFLARHIPILVAATQAIAFAHSRGIVHRDMKPHQVVVGSYGEVYLTDWGLALTFDAERLSESGGGGDQIDLPTPINASSPAGTVSYMAPEQAREEATDIGPWTDVYLLGATLYHLLVGRAPRTGKPTVELWKDAIQGIHTPLEEAAHGRPIPDDLHELVAAAMQARIGDRNLTADQFLQGLREHLSGTGRRRESEELAAESTRLLAEAKTYRDFNDAMGVASRALILWPRNAEAEVAQGRACELLARAALRNGDLTLARNESDRLGDSPVRRNLIEDVVRAQSVAAGRERARKRALVAVAGLLFVIILGGALFTQALSRERKEALRQRDLARENGLLAAARAKEAEQERAIAVRQMDNAIGLSTFMLDDLANSLDMNEERDRDIAAKITGSVARQVDAMATETLSVESRIKFSGFVGSVATHFLQLGRFEEAVQLLRNTEQATPRKDEYLTTRGNLLQSLTEALTLMGNFEEALSIAGEAEQYYQKAFGAKAFPATLKARGVALARLGRHKEAAEVLKQALDAIIAEKGESSPDIGIYLMEYASELAAEGKYDEAVPMMARGVELLQDNPSNPKLLATSINNLGVLYEEVGDLEKMTEAASRALDLAMAQYGPDHPNVQATRSNLAGSLARLGKIEEAEKLFRLAIDTLIRTGYHEKRYYVRIAVPWADFLRNHTARREESLEVLLDAKDVADRLGLADSDDYTIVLMSLGKTYRALGRHDESVEVLRRVRDIRRDRAGVGDKGTLGAWNELVVSLDTGGRTSEGAAELESKIAARRTLGQELEPELLHDLHQLGILYSRSGDLSKGEAILRSTAQSFRRAGLAGSNEHVQVLDNLAACLGIQDRDQDALLVFEEKANLLEFRSSQGPAELAAWLNTRAWYASKMRLDDAREDEADVILRDVLARAGAVTEKRPDLALVKVMALTFLQRFDEVPAACDEALALHPDEATRVEIERFREAAKRYAEEASEKVRPSPTPLAQRD